MLAIGNPFISAYVESDWFGRLIFFGLFLLSGISWAVLIHKGWVLFQVQRFSREFISRFSEKEPLSLQFKGQVSGAPNPLFGVYKTFKAKALAIVSRNHVFNGEQTPFSPEDLDFLDAEISVAINAETRKLEKNLFILPMVVTLGPFLGLLGTVWGILLAFSRMQGKIVAAGNEGMLAGLSLALVTTVVGLLIAIPALIGNSYFRNALREQRREMESFSHLLLSSTQTYYKQDSHAPVS